MTFSRDRKNLTAVHSYKWHGLVQTKGVGITLEPAKGVTAKGSRVVQPNIVLKTTARKGLNKPNKVRCKVCKIYQKQPTYGAPRVQGSASVRLSRATKGAAASINAATVGSHYRADLRAAALQRYSRLRQSYTKVRTHDAAADAKQ